ncbi:MAG TPA: ATP synthase subunit I [Bryobacteraceae bacterium]|nr:ATP synthase subunit I [Bryobacteraceae bacterium]
MDDLFFGRAAERITRITVVLAGAGTVVATAIAGWPGGVGFLLGAGASYLNFRWLKRVVDALGNAAASGSPPRARFAIVLGLRYLVLGAGAYVILKSSVLSLPAALAGLFVSVAAVVFEILFELVYAR